ncbi:TetR/AcrR family transcriptional regulator [Nocardia sp. NBC_01329]|uniref:TetR/AcrR family transcriptional regulator n=1 Tax=Nocardia sp. NBC_01329 TaxID=2903594 RepID=UPI002E12D0BB|nr:TetR/AcrR family transcriptional regulator [Nocardia sp. NBC_01329]
MPDETDALQVLAAADRLFNDRGVQAVGMDSIRDAANVPLKRLYQHYPSKADLVCAVLAQRDRDVRSAIAEFVDARTRTPRERVLAVFDFLLDWFEEPGFRGCLFINTVGELGGTSDEVGRIARSHKLAVRDYLADLVAECSLPVGLADQLMILANGAMVTAALHDEPQAARQARAAAEVLLAAAEERDGSSA